MSFLAPIFLLFGLLAIPIILLYMLRLRRQERTVSSTMLWQRLLKDREANMPWQRLRHNLLLLLQLLVLILLVISLARPFIPVPSVVKGSVVVMLDGSASMMASDMEPDRFTAAQEEVKELIGDLSGDDRMTLILVGHTPTVLLASSADKAALRQSVESAAARPVAADWGSAFALANGAAQGFRDAQIVIVSDGGLPLDLPPLATDVVYLPVGQNGNNLAVTALATRRSMAKQVADGRSQSELFTSVTNYGQNQDAILVSISLDDNLFDSKLIEVPSMESVNLTWNIPDRPALISARISEQDEDYLSHDDVSWAIHTGGIENRAALVSEGNRFLETVFSALPGIDVVRLDPQDPADREVQNFDLIIYDSVVVPEPIPDADLLIINPGENLTGTVTSEIYTLSGVFTGTEVLAVADSPLLQYVNWSDVSIKQAQHVTAPWAETLVRGEGGPLFLAGELDGNRIAILPFRLQESDLPLQIAFPVLMANITSWLNPGQSLDVDGDLLPGDPVRITPAAGTTAAIVVKPDGSRWIQTIDEESLVFGETDLLGVYEVLLRDDNGERSVANFAVNLFSSAESKIEPVENLHIGQEEYGTDEQENVAQRELWPWLTAFTLALLALEWWVYFRGSSFPRLTKIR